jgi:hypothetical protein
MARSIRAVGTVEYAHGGVKSMMACRNGCTSGRWPWFRYTADKHDEREGHGAEKLLIEVLFASSWQDH